MAGQQQQHGSGSRLAAAFRQAQQEARIRSSHVGIPAYPGNALPRSGVQPDARGMVLCPFCGKTYPWSQALLNRQLRCSGCRGIFRVADDRRSFRIQAAPAVVQPETGQISRATRVAVKEANSHLREAAEQALKALSRQDRPAPPGSETHLHARVVAPVQPAPLGRRRSGAVLTGEGAQRGRALRRAGLAIAGALIAILIAILVSLDGDDRREALWQFQSAGAVDLGYGPRLAAMRQTAASDRVDPVVGVDRAVIAAAEQVELSALRQATAGFTVLRRGEMWVESGRSGEAGALPGIDRLADPAVRKAFLAACEKAGIAVRTWEQMSELAVAGLPHDHASAIRLLLDRDPPRGGGLDAVALLASGQQPTRMELSAISGDSAGLLQQTGPPREPVAFAGRLVRLRGPGWPGRWQVLELRTR